MSKERRTVEWSLDFEDMRVRAGQFVSDTVGGTAEVKTAALAERLDGAASARVEIEFSVGRATLNALDAGSPNLFEAQLSYVGEYEFTVSGTAERVISLRQRGNFPRDIAATVVHARDLHWDIALAKNLPLQLKLTGGVGEANIDLGQLQVDDVQITTGVGKVALALPVQDQPMALDMRGGVGMTEVKIPAGAYGNFDIKGGVGEVCVEVSQDAAVRVEGKTGLGVINLPETFFQAAGSGKIATSKAWQTADFADAERQISITFSGGVGQFNLRTFGIT